MTVALQVLVVDDDPSIVKFVSAYLDAKGYKVTTAKDGLEALDVLGSKKIDLVILDMTMPRLGGIEVCERVRAWSQVPIIVLSARDVEDDKVRALELGADDYLIKPFGARELLARIQTVLRRHLLEHHAATRVSVGDLTISLMQRDVQIGEHSIKLTPTEYKLLCELAFNSGKVLTHLTLLNRVWGLDYREDYQYLHVFVGRLRTKMRSAGASRCHIVTIPGVGYQLRAEPSNDDPGIMGAASSIDSAL